MPAYLAYISNELLRSEMTALNFFSWPKQKHPKHPSGHPATHPPAGVVVTYGNSTWIVWILLEDSPVDFLLETINRSTRSTRSVVNEGWVHGWYANPSER